MKQASVNKGNDFQKPSFIDQKKEITFLKRQLKKRIQGKNEMEENIKFVMKYLKDILDDNRILSNENLRLKNIIKDDVKSINCLIDSSNFWREQLQEQEFLFNGLCIDYNLLSDTKQNRFDNPGRNISANFLKVVKK